MVAIAALAQVTMASRFEVVGVVPNVVLVTLVVIGWTLGPRAAMVLACAGGLLLDLATAGPLGPHALALLPGAYLAGYWSRRSRTANLPAVALAAALATVLYSGVVFVAYAPSGEAAARMAVVGAMYNAALTLCGLVLVRWPSLGRISRRAQA